MNPSSSGPTPLNPRGGRGQPGAGEEKQEQQGEGSAAAWQSRSESSISTEAQAVRTLASAHKLAGELENEARRRADEITARADLEAAESERHARARAEALIAEAKAERDQIWEQIRVGVGRATRQVGDLLRIREELRLDLRAALEGTGESLERLEEGGGEPVDPPAPPAWLPSAPPAPGATPPRTPPAAIQGRASELPSPLSPAPGGAPTAPRSGPGASPAAEGPAPASPGAKPLTALRAGPFASFLEVMRFERELAGLEGVDGVYVRRYSNQEVDVEVSAAAAAEVATAIRAMPAVESVQAADGVLEVRMHEQEQGPE